jgi:hypothetical protein
VSYNLSDTQGFEVRAEDYFNRMAVSLQGDRTGFRELKRAPEAARTSSLMHAQATSGSAQAGSCSAQGRSPSAQGKAASARVKS